ncbi:MAG: SpoIIE family protein phosphatase [Bacillota bacterium]
MIKDLLELKNYDYILFEVKQIDELINNQKKYGIIICFNIDKIIDLDNYIGKFKINTILIGNKETLKYRNKPIIRYYNRKDITLDILVNKINTYTRFKKINKTIDLVLDDTNITAIVFDEKGYISYVNETFTNQIGYSKEEIIDKSIYTLKSDYHSLMFYDNIVQTIRSNTKWTGRIKIRKKDGNFIWEECVIKPFKKCKYKQYYIIIAINKDKIIKNKNEYKREIQMAASIQNSILSKPLKNDDILINAKYYPLNKISGDTYYWDKLSENKYIILLSDVVGHGIGSALVTTAINTIIKDLINQWENGEKFLKDLNNKIIDFFSKNKKAKDFYFTAIFLEINTLEKTIKYFNCGHPHIYYFNNKVKKLYSKNFPIGLFKENEFKSRTEKYNENSELLLYTDGLKDLDMNYRSGLNILDSILKKYMKNNENLLSYIEQEYLEHYFDKVKDDISLISIKLFKD